MKPGLRTKNSHQLFLFSSLFLALLLAACGTLQVDLAPTPGSTPRPGVPITPTPWFGPAQYETEAGVIFDDRLKLLGYTVKPDGNEIESRITVTLIWEVLDKIDADYNTFVHLLNKEEQLLAQSDQPTGGGWRQSSDWIIKEYVYDQHHLQLPNSMSLDDVVIQIGLYDFNDGRRLDVESPNSYTLQAPAPTPGRPPANLDSPKVTKAPQIDEPDNMATSPPPDESFPDVTPGPTATPHVEKTAAAPSPDVFELRVAYVKDADVWIWDAESGPEQLTLGGGVEVVWISDDGLYIAFIRDGDIWAVNSDGGSERQLTHAEDFQELSLDPEIEPYVTAIGLTNMAWQPGSHRFYLSTSPQMEGPGLFLSDDLWMVDVDSGELSMVLAPGEGGNFYFSPDGRKLAIVTPGRIDLMDAGGSGRREAFTHTPVITFSEFEYYAQPVWAPDSNSLRVAIPPADSSAASAGPTSIWYIPVEDRPAWLVGQVTTLPGLHTPPIFAPNLARLAYLTGGSLNGDADSDLPDMAIAELSENKIWDPILFPAEVMSPHGWSPDGLRLLFRSPAAPIVEIKMGQPDIKPVFSGDDQNLILDVNWLDNTGFLYLQQSSTGWDILLGWADLGNRVLIDSAGGGPISYDSALLPAKTAGQ